MKKILFLCLSTLCISAYPLDIKQLKLKLSQKLPKETIVDVLATPLSNIYEVDTNSRVFYTDEDANYIFVGNLIDLANKKSLTDESLKRLTQANWNKLPFNSAFILTRGKGTNKLAVFTDLDCTFCKRLEIDTLSKLDDVTIYYFLYTNPAHSASYLQASQVICSENKSQVYHDYMVLATPLPSYSDCSNTKDLVTIKNFADTQLHLEVTPTIITSSGEIIKGLVPLNYLKQHMNNN